MTDLDEALARIAELEAVLAFYADEARWRMNSSGITSALDDAGFRAREALTTTLAAVPMTGEEHRPS